MTAVAPLSATPVPLTPSQLVDYTRLLAEEVRAGMHEVGFDPQTRWHRRIYRDARVDVWIISWLPDQGTQLHDHGGSSGAFTVVDGSLDEATYVASGRGAGTLRDRVHEAGRSVGFGPRYVHDVRNLGSEPAVSVHAYSPPLTEMSFYDVEGGHLVPFATLDTDDPETPVPDAVLDRSLRSAGFDR